MNQPENESKIKTLGELYEEEKELIKKEKSIFTETLNAISLNIANKKSVENFLKANRKENEPIIPEIKEKQNEILIFFNMKILRVVFMTLYITGVYIFIGFMDSVMGEIKASAKLYLFNTTRNDDETFFDNYNKLNQEPPEFELFFLTSNLSDKILYLVGVYGQSIIIIGINALIFFGIYHFDFHIFPGNINTRYTIWEFLYLVLMYILLYLSIGFISSFSS